MILEVHEVKGGFITDDSLIIANGWKIKGWCGSDKGLRKISDCIEVKGNDGKSKWKCVNKKAELPPAWKSEEEFFSWIKVPFIHPSKRNI